MRQFRRYYEVKDGGIKVITSSSFLRQIGDYSSQTGLEEDSKYNEFVRRAWSRFNRDIDNEVGKVQLHKHQVYFERKLTSIATHTPNLTIRAKQLQPFVLSRMRQSYQPYKSLATLHRKIDRDTSINDQTIIEGLERIQNKYRGLEVLKSIRKPQVLYSMMVRS